MYTQVKCSKCSRSFTKRGMARHMSSAHPIPPPPPPPRKTTETEVGEIHEHTLLGGKGIKLGDVVWHVRKCVVTTLTETEGSKDIKVVLRTTKRNYQLTEPQ